MTMSIGMNYLPVQDIIRNVQKSNKFIGSININLINIVLIFSTVFVAYNVQQLELVMLLNSSLCANFF